MRTLVYGMCLLLMLSCSSDDAAEQEQSVIDEAVRKSADKAVQYIQEPIEKAETVKALGEERNKKLADQTQ